MRFMSFCVYLFSCCLFSVALASPIQLKPKNANHIFNAIHSSMRQWGSSLNHNGMSLFLATVPAGTQLYHGTWKKGQIEGLEWLAFEPEHALVFAGPRWWLQSGDGNRPLGPKEWNVEGKLPEKLYQNPTSKEPQEQQHKFSLPPQAPPPHHDGELRPRPSKPHLDLRPLKPLPPPHHPHGELPRPPPPPPPTGHHSPPPDNRIPPPGYHKRPPHHLERKHVPQQPLKLSTSEQPSRTGYLHTYVTKNALRLLYIDGLSAGKTSNGTLDTQDRLLLNLTEIDDPMGGEIFRAYELCDLSATLWENKIDGILRMEGGFEIILCNFTKHLERRDVVATTRHRGPGKPGILLGSWQYFKAVTSRYNGIGGERVIVDYEDFVSVFAYPNIEGLFKNDVISDYAMPRLQNVQDSDLLRIRADVTAMILRKDWTNGKGGRNWQAIADEVVQRYSTPLHELHTSAQLRDDKDMISEYLSTLLRPFIDHTARNATLETSRCVLQFIPPLPSPPLPATSLAHRTLHTVTQRICDTLLTSLSIASSATSHASFTSVYASHAIEVIDELVEYLRWTTWKKCNNCADDEICWIPIWPMGKQEDHANPQCRNEESARGRLGYWGSPPRAARHGDGFLPYSDE